MEGGKLLALEALAARLALKKSAFYDANEFPTGGGPSVKDFLFAF